MELFHRKCLASSNLITEEITIPITPSQSESSMDFIVDPSGLESTMLVIPSHTKKIVKMEHFNRKPLFSSTKASLRNLS